MTRRFDMSYSDNPYEEFREGLKMTTPHNEEMIELKKAREPNVFDKIIGDLNEKFSVFMDSLSYIARNPNSRTIPEGVINPVTEAAQRLREEILNGIDSLEIFNHSEKIKDLKDKIHILQSEIDERACVIRQKNENIHHRIGSINIPAGSTNITVGGGGGGSVPGGPLPQGSGGTVRGNEPGGSRRNPITGFPYSGGNG